MRVLDESLRTWSSFLLTATLACLAACKQPRPYDPPDPDRPDSGSDAREGGRGGVQGAVDGPASLDPFGATDGPAPATDVLATDAAPFDVPSTAEPPVVPPVSNPPGTPCSVGVACTQGIAPCRRGVTTCPSPMSSPVCVDAGPDDSRGGCAGGNVCKNGSCVAPCAAGMPCLDGIGPCRRGMTACASPTSQPECKDVGADDSRVGSAGSCTSNPGQDDCISGTWACSNGARVCVNGATKCSANQLCQNGSCVARCMGGGSCTDNPNQNRCRNGTYSCAGGVRQCVDGTMKTSGSCEGGRVCNRDGNCVEPCARVGDPCCSGSCQNGLYCNGDRCAAKKEFGSTCSGTDECKMGVCTQSRCCRTACNSGEGCLREGTCGKLNGTSCVVGPQMGCLSGYCDAPGVCLKNGMPHSCVSDAECDPDDTCKRTGFAGTCQNPP